MSTGRRGAGFDLLPLPPPGKEAMLATQSPPVSGSNARWPSEPPAWLAASRGAGMKR
jgi:hypothetical protein